MTGDGHLSISCTVHPLACNPQHTWCHIEVRVSTVVWLLSGVRVGVAVRITASLAFSSRLNRSALDLLLADLQLLPLRGVRTMYFDDTAC